MEYIKNCLFLCLLLAINGITNELPQEAVNEPIRIFSISPEDQNKIYFIDSDETDTEAHRPWEQPPDKSVLQENVEIDPKILEEPKENPKPAFLLVHPPKRKEVNIVLGSGKENSNPGFSLVHPPNRKEVNIVLGSGKENSNPGFSLVHSPNRKEENSVLGSYKESSKPGFSLVAPPNGEAVNMMRGSGKENSKPGFSLVPPPNRTQPPRATLFNKVKNYFTPVETKLSEELHLFGNHAIMDPEYGTESNINWKLPGPEEYDTESNNNWKPPGLVISTQVKKIKKRSLSREGRRSSRRNNNRYQPKEYPDFYNSYPTFFEEPPKKNYIYDDNYYKINDRRNNDLDDVQVLKPSDYPKSYKPITPRRSLPICGRRNTRPFSQNIIGGTSVALGEYPWMALIQYRGRNKITNGCGGTLVNSWFVLTAAHCVDDNVLQKRNLKLHRIILGEYDTKTEFDCTEGPSSLCADAIKVYNAEEIIKHEKFDIKNALHDIALIRLDIEVEFSDYVKPICLPTSSLSFDQSGKESLIVAGWGRTSTKGSYSRKLIKATLPVVSQDFCTIRGVTLTPGQLCLGMGSGIDTCTGDSGGPMMMQTLEDSEVVTYQMGIISYGFATEECGQAPSVNTFVPYYLEWINSQIR